MAASGAVGHRDSPRPSGALAWALEAACPVSERNDSPASGLGVWLAALLQGKREEAEHRLICKSEFDAGKRRNKLNHEAWEIKTWAW